MELSRAFPTAPAIFEYTAGPDKVAQSIWIVLDTAPGERVMRPTFGCGLRRYLMAPNTAATRALIKHDVQIALANFEPRITVTDLQVRPGRRSGAGADPDRVRAPCATTDPGTSCFRSTWSSACRSRARYSTIVPTSSSAMS